MGTDTLDPVIHAPARLRIVATLAALPAGDTLSFTRLQDMLDLTPGNLITHLRKLEDAGYLTSETTGNGRASRTSMALTTRAAPRSTPTPTRYATCSTGCRHIHEELNDMKTSLIGRITVSVVLLVAAGLLVAACGGSASSDGLGCAGPSPRATRPLRRRSRRPGRGRTQTPTLRTPGTRARLDDLLGERVQARAGLDVQAHREGRGRRAPVRVVDREPDRAGRRRLSPGSRLERVRARARDREAARGSIVAISRRGAGRDRMASPSPTERCTGSRRRRLLR